MQKTAVRENGARFEVWKGVGGRSTIKNKLWVYVRPLNQGNRGFFFRRPVRLVPLLERQTSWVRAETSRQKNWTANHTRWLG